MKIFKFKRFICATQVADDIVFDITQKSGTKYSFPLAFGWMTEESPPGSPYVKPFTAFTCFLGPLSVAIGYIKP